MKHQESNLQAACVQWFRLQYPQHVIFAIPNGGNRSAATGAMMKREGVLAGVADLFLMVPTAHYHGLFIEMKTGNGKVQESQKVFCQKAIESGYLYMVCRSFDDFTGLVKGYLELQKYDTL